MNLTYLGGGKEKRMKTNIYQVFLLCQILKYFPYTIMFNFCRLTYQSSEIASNMSKFHS